MTNFFSSALCLSKSTMTLKLSVLSTELPGERKEGGDILDDVVFDINDAVVRTV